MISLLAAEVVNPLPVPGIMFGVLAFGIFALIGAITWSYRDLANRNSHKSSGTGAQH